MPDRSPSRCQRLVRGPGACVWVRRGPVSRPAGRERVDARNGERAAETMRIPSRDNALTSAGDGDRELDWNRGPSAEHPTEYIGIHDPSVLAQLHANRNRADLHLTSCAALIFLLFAVILFSLNNSDNDLSYDNEMQEAVCTVIDQQLQQMEDPDVDMPPDIDLPVPLKWRAEERVHVKPETRGTSPFDAVVYDTVRTRAARFLFFFCNPVPANNAISLLASTLPPWFLVARALSRAWAPRRTHPRTATFVWPMGSRCTAYPLQRESYQTSCAR
jgi:hypothetical protein